MSKASTLDDRIHRILTRKWDESHHRAYFAGVETRQAAMSPSIDRTFQAIDVKATGLLTHVSMMVAGLGVCASLISDRFVEDAVIIGEIMIYLVIAVGCLRCIAAVGAVDEGPDVAAAEALLRREVVIRQEIYIICNRAAIITTVLVFVSLPILLAV
jgi:hypothetical protein